MAKDVLDYQPTTTNTTTSNALGANVEASNYHFINTTGVKVNYTIEATHDADGDFSGAVQVASGSVSAGGSTNTVLTAPWDQVRVNTTPANAPSSGSVTVKQHR